LHQNHHNFGIAFSSLESIAELLPFYPSEILDNAVKLGSRKNRNIFKTE
jgi:hypothetical protein